MSENSVEKAVNAAFEAGRKAQAAGVVVDWEATGDRMANALIEDNKRLEQEVLSEQEAMREMSEKENLIDKD